MSEKLQEFLEVPQEFIHEGNQVRHSAVAPAASLITLRSFLFDAQNPLEKVFELMSLYYTSAPIYTLLRRVEFVQISKAVAIGFAVMGFIGYLVKLIHIPM